MESKKNRSFCFQGMVCVIGALIMSIFSCKSYPSVYLKELDGLPTVKKHWPYLDVNLPYPKYASTAYLKVDVSKANTTIEVHAVFVNREIPFSQTINMEAMGFKKLEFENSRVLWCNPDGTKVRIDSNQ